MKIVVLTGSPRVNGVSNYLAERFIEGASTKGHDIFRFDAGLTEDIHSCTGCDVCGMNGPCQFKDVIEREVTPRLVACDLLVLVTPIYFAGVSGQLKTCIDRFYSRTGRIGGKASMFLVASDENNKRDVLAIQKYYATLASYMGWQNKGVLVATGCSDRASESAKNYGEEAFNLGRGL